MELWEKKEKAREVLEKMENLGSTQGVGNIDMGAVYMALGEFDNAFQYFEKAIEKHEGRLFLSKYSFRLFPVFEKTRGQKIIRKIGLPNQ